VRFSCLGGEVQGEDGPHREGRREVEDEEDRVVLDVEKRKMRAMDVVLEKTQKWMGCAENDTARDWQYTECGVIIEDTKASRKTTVKRGYRDMSRPRTETALCDASNRRKIVQEQESC
jgi:hypothetical protein